MRTVTVTALMLIPARLAFAHGLEHDSERAVWTFDPWVTIPLIASVSLYALGSIKLWQRSRSGRHVQVARMALFGFGWTSLAAALTSPLHWLGEHLFTFHMIEHEVVMAASAPLFVMSRPVSAFLWSMPRSVRQTFGSAMNFNAVRRIWAWGTSGLNATVLHGVAIWGWHIPWLFDVSVTNENVHRLQHLSFFLTALLFWWSVLWRCSHGVAAWHLFVTMVHTSILGSLMALSPRVLYFAQTAQAQAWGLTSLEDQQLAGMLMWIPAGTVYAGAALAMLTLWIKQSGREKV